MTQEPVQAMVFDEPGRVLRRATFRRPTLSPGEMLVDVTCCTLCGSDLHTISGRRHAPVPSVLGHEILGRVAELPPGEPVRDFSGRPLAVGDRVTWAVAASCGECFFCRRGWPQKCERLFKYGHQSIDAGHPLCGGLAEACHLAAGTAILRVPDELPDVVACPANCATATVAAALRLAGPCRGEVVLVQGAGMLGLTAAAMLSAAGAAERIVCDVNAARLTMAERFGATKTVIVDEGETLRETIDKLTAGRGVDLVLELSGATAAAEASIDLLRIGGRAVWVGAVLPGRPIQVSAETVVRRCLSIRGIHNYAPGDLAAALEFLAGHHQAYPFAELVGARYPLSRADEAIQYALGGRTPRVAVVPDALGSA